MAVIRDRAPLGARTRCDPDSPPHSRFPGLVRSGLDLLIVTYVAALGVLAMTGGIDLGIVTLHEAAKPLFVLLVVVPIRIALGGSSWLRHLMQRPIAYGLSSWRLASARVPPAVADSLFAVVMVLIATVSAGFLASIVLEPARPPGFTLPFSNAHFVGIFAAWDSGWYWDIAMRGYYFRPDAQSSIAFFPLYPMLMHAAAAPFGGGAKATWIAGIVVGLSAYLLALVAVHRFTERIFGSREVARRTVLYLAVFPWSLFMVRVYTESVFLLASVLAVSRAYDGRWRQAGVWGALATLARPNGILIACPLVLLAIRDRPRPGEFARRCIVLAPIPAALAGYSAYVYSLTGDPLGWMSAQAHWGYSIGHPPWRHFVGLISGVLEHGPYRFFFTSDIVAYEILHAVPALLFLTLTPLIVQRLGLAMGAYVLASLLVPLSGSTLEGLGRYASVLFPAFMLVGSMTSQRMHEAILIISLAFQTLLVCLFVTWHPIY
ncbi:hypothetical protein BH23ACI1_BH23ACI1_17910 [soil metagenome]